MPLSAPLQVVRSMAAALPGLAVEGQWVPLRRATQFLLWLTHHAPGSASMFIAAKGTVRIQGGCSSGCWLLGQPVVQPLCCSGEAEMLFSRRDMQRCEAEQWRVAGPRRVHL